LEKSPQNQDGRAAELLSALVEGKVISGAQANVVENDHASTGMAIEDILIARGWVKEEQLATYAPWLAESENNQKGASGAKPSRTFEENLKKYRSLLAEMLGESSE
jgi:hypothetical protein